VRHKVGRLVIGRLGSLRVAMSDMRVYRYITRFHARSEQISIIRRNRGEILPDRLFSEILGKKIPLLQSIVDDN